MFNIKIYSILISILGMFEFFQALSATEGSTVSLFCIFMRTVDICWIVTSSSEIFRTRLISKFIIPNLEVKRIPHLRLPIHLYRL